jgi:branched-subunit amino acid aminotransferase/4-amino-4-deoxychorismate lyase
MAESTLYEFTGSSLEPVNQRRGASQRVIAADSWLVVDGRVVAFDEHWDRFTRAVMTHQPQMAASLEGFFLDAVRLIPSAGRWFPRVECVASAAGPVLRLLHRVAPPRLTEAVLATAPSDPRTSPRTKGPDLDALMALRRAVEPTGATEAVILTPEGFIAEGAYSALVAIPPEGDELWVVESGIARIASVTETVVVAIAQGEGVRVLPRVMTPDALEGHAVWILSALHGIREATAWIGGPHLFPNPALRQHWSNILTATATYLAAPR